MVRTARERVLQTLAYEAGGLAIVTPAYMALFGTTGGETLTLMVVLSVLILVWIPIHNTLFDLAEFRLTGRPADRRPHALRIVHAVSLETTSIVLSTPALMILGGHDLMTALVVDVGLTTVFAAYAYGFHMAWDRLRPIR